jgi:hypothetical protein
VVIRALRINFLEPAERFVDQEDSLIRKGIRQLNIVDIQALPGTPMPES